MAKKKRYYSEMNGMMKKDEMISSNMNAHANLPQEVIMRDYPKMEYGVDRAYDDTRAKIDKQVGNDTRALRNHPAKKTY